MNKKFYLPTLGILAIAAAIAAFVLPDKIFKAGNTELLVMMDDNRADSFSDTSEMEPEKENPSDESILEEETEEKVDSDETTGENADSYPLHQGITATVFWVGEKASQDNEEISNKSSAWDGKWKEHFGGTDDPKKRNGYYPEKFTPNENPFYFALPYNDFDINGNRRENSKQTPWAGEKSWDNKESMVKNRWAKITHGGKTCYGQWEDVGPFKENDFEYVFGSSLPKNEINKNAGIDVSPAIRDCLGLEGLGKVDWQFVDFENVPDGPWKKIITNSQISWN